jgi:hypothetical protein
MILRCNSCQQPLEHNYTILIKGNQEDEFNCDNPRCTSYWNNKLVIIGEQLTYYTLPYHGYYLNGSRILNYTKIYKVKDFYMLSAKPIITTEYIPLYINNYLSYGEVLTTKLLKLNAFL